MPVLISWKVRPGFSGRSNYAGGPHCSLHATPHIALSAVSNHRMTNEIAVGKAWRLGKRSGWLWRNRGKAIALLVVAVLLVWFLWPVDAMLPPPMTAAVTRGDIEVVIAASGTLDAGRLVDVGVQVSGQLKKLHVQLGDVVSEGDLLAEIDDSIQRTRLSSAEASLKTLEATLASQEASLSLSRGVLKRQERLMEAQATTEVEYERAVVGLSQSEANLVRHLLQIEQAEAGVDEARALLDFTRITAPADGTIVSVYVQEGQTLNAAHATPTILRIGDLRTIRVSANISEADMRRLTLGMQAYFTTPADGERRWYGSLTEISPIPQGPNRLGGLAQFDALVEVNNSDGALLPGMTAKVFFLEAAARNVLKVPLGVLSFADGPMSAAGQFALQASPSAERGVGSGLGASVLDSVAGSDTQGTEGDASSSGEPDRGGIVQVVGGNGEIQPRVVRVGVSNDAEAEILSGLDEGERVVSGTQQPPMPDRRRRSSGG